MTQLTALVAELRKEVCNLETSIEDEEDRAPNLRASIFHVPPRPIVAHLRARRDNLLLTISTLENQLNDPHKPARRSYRVSYAPPISRPPPPPALGECGMVEINRRLLSLWLRQRLGLGFGLGIADGLSQHLA
jgi:hypothetical protein